MFASARGTRAIRVSKRVQVCDERGGKGCGSDEREREAALLDDSRFVPEAKEGSTALSLPPRNYILVHEDGRLHKTDDFEPMSFGMQRIHKNDEPEPVWVQTRTARWMRKRARAERARATTLARLAC